MEILLVGQADHICFEHYSKNLKAKFPDINLDVFSIDAIKGKYDLSAFKTIHENQWDRSVLSKLRGLRIILQPLYTWISLFFFLKKGKKHYDIIHFKWIVPGVVMFPGLIHKHCRKTIATLWDTEWDVFTFFF